MDGFNDEKRFCDITVELVDEAGLVHFYKCTRDPGHEGGWHIGYEFGPNRGDNNEMQMWPVNASHQRSEQEGS